MTFFREPGAALTERLASTSRTRPLLAFRNCPTQFFVATRHDTTA